MFILWSLHLNYNTVPTALNGVKISGGMDVFTYVRQEICDYIYKYRKYAIM